jgi:hypothetical protein
VKEIAASREDSATGSSDRDLMPAMLTLRSPDGSGEPGATHHRAGFDAETMAFAHRMYDLVRGGQTAEPPGA